VPSAFRASAAIALLVGIGLVLVAVAFADELLDVLAISPEAFRIAVALVLAATGVRTIVWPRSTPGRLPPFSSPRARDSRSQLWTDEPAGRCSAAPCSRCSSSRR
jgi:small neutral amino acid transporter SnatA (MarC family)